MESGVKVVEVTDDQFWLLARQSLLSFLDTLERWRGIEPRTAKIRKWARARYPSDVAIRAEDVKTRIVELEVGVE